MTNTELKSPWHGLPTTPHYILPEDLERIQLHRNFSNLRLDTVPGQVIGGLNTAEVVFLALNPGFVQDDIDINLNLPGFLEANRYNHEDPYNSPFYYFNEGLETTAGYEWWSRILKPLVRAGITEATLRDKIMAVEYFPYHSIKYKNLPIVPSQQFAFDLVHEAIERNKIIVIMRSKDLWFGAVPPLKDYPCKMMVKNPRQPYASPANLGEENFNALLSRLR